MATLFRVTSLASWMQALETGALPRCPADRRDDCIHVNAGADVEKVATAYFTADENPVALELDASSFSGSLAWVQATPAKPWPQARLDIPNILTTHVLSVTALVPVGDGDEITFARATAIPLRRIRQSMGIDGSIAALTPTGPDLGT